MTIVHSRAEIHLIGEYCMGNLVGTLVRDIYIQALDEQGEEVVFVLEKDTAFPLEIRNDNYYAIGNGFEFLIENHEFKFSKDTVLLH